MPNLNQQIIHFVETSTMVQLWSSGLNWTPSKINVFKRKKKWKLVLKGLSDVKSNKGMINTEHIVMMFILHVSKEQIFSFTITTIKGSCLENSLDTNFFQYPLFHIQLHF